MEINDEYLEKVRSEFIWCCGDIYKRNLEGEDELVEKDVRLQYDTVKNIFLREEDICYAALYFEAVIDGDLKCEEEMKTLLEDCYLYTEVPRISGMLYIDKSSVYEIKKGRFKK